MATTLVYEPVDIPIDHFFLKGHLRTAENAKGLVLFSHGSGSSRFSVRNNYVADYLLEKGFSSLLFDLLTEKEDHIYENRFDIKLLKDRLVKATQWLLKNKSYNNLPIGYFGSSTGAASALWAASELGDNIKAIVSRGGRPDLAMPILHHITAPTLLLVGGLDNVVIELNKTAQRKFSGICKLKIIEGATHLFTESGKLTQVAEASSQWFADHLKSSK